MANDRLSMRKFKEVLRLKFNHQLTNRKIAKSRRRKDSRVRARIAIGFVKTHGVSLAEAARQLGVSTFAISKTLIRAS